MWKKVFVEGKYEKAHAHTLQEKNERYNYSKKFKEIKHIYAYCKKIFNIIIYYRMIWSFCSSINPNNVYDRLGISQVKLHSVKIDLNCE